MMMTYNVPVALISIFSLDLSMCSFRTKMTYLSLGHRNRTRYTYPC